MVEVSIEFLQSVYDQMELMWYQINAEWGPAGDRLEQAIKDGHEPTIAKLRELIDSESGKGQIAEECNLDTDAKDSEIICCALLMWRNYIQTGDVVLSAVDACNMGQEDRCRQLNAKHQEFVIRLEELAARQSP